MTAHLLGKNWHVVRQFNHKADSFVCAHRFEWVAELCAHRRTSSREHKSEVGVFYTVRPAVIA